MRIIVICYIFFLYHSSSDNFNIPLFILYPFLLLLNKHQMIHSNICLKICTFLYYVNDRYVWPEMAHTLNTHTLSHVIVSFSLSVSPSLFEFW